jgi:hypothetical protein
LDKLSEWFEQGAISASNLVDELSKLSNLNVIGSDDWNNIAETML